MKPEIVSPSDATLKEAMGTKTLGIVYGIIELNAESQQRMIETIVSEKRKIFIFMLVLYSILIIAFIFCCFFK